MPFAPEPGRPNGGRLIEFPNSLIAQGSVFVTAPDLSTGKSVNLKIGGPIHVSIATNTVVLEDPGIISGLPTNLLPQGLPMVAFIYGRVVLGFDAQGNITSATFRGTAQDVCELLQELKTDLQLLHDIGSLGAAGQQWSLFTAWALTTRRDNE